MAPAPAPAAATGGESDAVPVPVVASGAVAGAQCDAGDAASRSGGRPRPGSARSPPWRAGAAPFREPRAVSADARPASSRGRMLGVVAAYSPRVDNMGAGHGYHELPDIRCAKAASHNAMVLQVLAAAAASLQLLLALAVL